MMFYLSLVNCNLILAHLSRKLRGELIEKQSSRRPTVRPCMRPSSVNPFKHQYLSEQRVDCNQILPEELLGRGKCYIRFGKIGPELWFPWQHIASIGL